MNHGGYQIIDFKGKNITSTKQKIPGIYEKIEGTRKPLLLANVTINSKEMHNAFAQANVSGQNFTINIGDWGLGSSYDLITVEPDDNVSIG